MRSTYPILCKECGAGIRLIEGANLGRCPYCKTWFSIGTPLGIHRYYIKPFVSTKPSCSTIAYECLKNEKIGGAILESSLLFSPFYQVRGDVIGYISWKRPIKKTFIKGEIEGEVKIREIIEGGERFSKILDWSTENLKGGSYIFPALSMKEFGLYELKEEIEAGITDKDGLNSYDEDEMHRWGTVFTPQNFSLNNILKEAESYFRGILLLPYSGSEEVRSVLSTLRQGLQLVFVPIWIVRYLSSGNLYRMTLSGITGKILYLEKPKEIRSKNIKIILGIMTGSFLFLE